MLSVRPKQKVNGRASRFKACGCAQPIELEKDFLVH
jgi:hypothetical protein